MADDHDLLTAAPAAGAEVLRVTAHATEFGAPVGVEYGGDAALFLATHPGNPLGEGARDETLRTLVDRDYGGHLDALVLQGGSERPGHRVDLDVAESADRLLVPDARLDFLPDAVADRATRLDDGRVDLPGGLTVDGLGTSTDVWGECQVGRPVAVAAADRRLFLGGSVRSVDDHLDELARVERGYDAVLRRPVGDRAGDWTVGTGPRTEWAHVLGVDHGPRYAAERPEDQPTLRSPRGRLGDALDGLADRFDVRITAGDHNGDVAMVATPDDAAVGVEVDPGASLPEIAQLVEPNPPDDDRVPAPPDGPVVLPAPDYPDDGLDDLAVFGGAGPQVSFVPAGVVGTDTARLVPYGADHDRIVDGLAGRGTDPVDAWLSERGHDRR